MRTITVTEKYKAVNEGRMAKSEFVRQMRQEYPMYISNFDGFDSAVQILKNKQMLFEAKKSEAKAPVYDEKPALNYSLDALDRGIRAELQIDGVDFKEAEKRAKSNLEKNATHYLDLLSGESNKVDKHDKEVEVKRGAGTVDTFNGLKKATLKEEVNEDEEEDAKNDLDSYDHDFPHQDEDVVNPNPPMSEDAKKALLGKVVGALRANYPDITVGIIKDFIRTHADDLLGGEDIESEFVEYISNNYEGPSDMGEKKGTDHDGDGDIDGDDYMAAKDAAIKKATGKDEGYAMKRMQRAHQQASQAGEKSAYDKKDKEKQKDQKDKLKEAIKSIIKKTLNEDVVNEAATGRLSQKMEDFGAYAGAQNVINSLENIVTEVESFYGKVRDKIQKVYNDMESIENDEGLKIGQFIGPSIESAFLLDLRPVTKKGFTQDLQLPKAKRLDPNLVAQARAQGDIEEIGDAKHTVFTPNI